MYVYLSIMMYNEPGVYVILYHTKYMLAGAPDFRIRMRLRFLEDQEGQNASKHRLFWGFCKKPPMIFNFAVFEVYCF